MVSTYGGIGQEAEEFHKIIAHPIVDKRNETYSSVVNYIRTRLRFCLLKSVLTSIRGVREKRVKDSALNLSQACPLTWLTSIIKRTGNF